MICQLHQGPEGVPDNVSVESMEKNQTESCNDEEINTNHQMGYQQRHPVEAFTRWPNEYLKTANG